MEDDKLYYLRRKAYFRDRITLTLIISAIVVASTQLVPGLIAAIRDGRVLNLIFYLITTAVMAVLFALRKRQSRVRFALILATAYLVGIFLLWRDGPEGVGDQWLIVGPILAVLLLDLPGAVTALAANVVILAVAGFLVSSGILPWRVPAIGYWLYAVHHLTVGAICVTAVATLIKGLEATIASEKKLLDEVEGNKARLDREIEIRNRIEDVMRRRERKFRSILECSPDAVCVLNDRGVILYVSGSIKRILGWEPGELVGAEIFSLVHPEEKLGLKNNLLVDIDEGEREFTGEVQMKSKSGEWAFCEVDARILIDDPLVGGIILNLRDVSRLKTAEERAEFYQYYDPLTKLPNKQKFLGRIKQELDRAPYRSGIFAVMTLGIDRFKQINELHGLQAGDEVLKRVGENLMKILRADDLVSRSRGDKFIILLSDIKDASHIHDIVSKSQRAVSEPVALGDATIKITSSIGIAFYPNDGRGENELLNNSETAMYLAKEAGRNAYRLFDAEMNLRILNRIKLEDGLTEAIRKEEFALLFQPKVTGRGGIAGAEALVRWKRWDGSLVTPDSFISIAERNGSIVDIGAIVLRNCCLQGRVWQQAGLPAVRLAVNLSPYQFMHSGLIQSISAVIKQTGFNPASLELEITESGIMEDEQDSIRKLNELHEMGFGIAIDDFGTGYSSFGKLKDYPIDTLKIDKSFIAGIPGNQRAEKIVSAIIDLAHNLAYDVVAEGVENEAQASFLERLHCDQYQGYYYAHPLPAHEFQEILKGGVLYPEMDRRN